MARKHVQVKNNIIIYFLLVVGIPLDRIGISMSVTPASWLIYKVLIDWILTPFPNIIVQSYHLVQQKYL